jgi:hypothetical protein
MQAPLSSQMSAGVSVSPTHDCSAPQCVPAGLLLAVSTQVFAPVLHDVTPTLQAPGFVVHRSPAAQATHVPALLQTLSVPQLVPAPLLPASTQVVVPVEQDVVPFLQGAFGLPEQSLPAVQDTQVPEPLQTMFVPQLVPAPLLLPSTHVIAPVEQDVVPFLQAAFGLVAQPVPAVQAPQVPEPLQTMFVPQLVPAALLLASMHVIPPVEQDVMPFLQAALGFVVQPFPAVHEPQAPEPLQTMFVPQLVPAALLLPSTHVIAPVEQDVVPFLQAALGFVVQPVPVVQEPQSPEPLQTMFVPQLVPAALLLPSRHVIRPVTQDVVPFLQAFGLFVHALPAVHPPQLPMLQTRFVPQIVPFATFPVSAQTGTPVTHEVAPVLQWFVGWQAAPVLHTLQVPLLQTMFVPHDAPLARFRPVSEHVIVGEQVCVPAWHGLAGVQTSPGVHDAQTPELHTMFVPQDVPFATFPDSIQTGPPEVQTVVPVRQGLPVTEQLAPAVQFVHTPVALQTLLVPHAVPAARFVFLSVQTGDPVEQASVPAWQGFDGVQVAPSWHATHFPVWQTSPVPQAVPFGLSAVSVQTGAPVAHEIAPVRQAFVVVQTPSATQASHAPLLQTMLVPQAMPFACAVPVSMQSRPVAPQVVRPTWQEFEGMQAPPPVHPP